MAGGQRKRTRTARLEVRLNVLTLRVSRYPRDSPKEDGENPWVGGRQSVAINGPGLPERVKGAYGLATRSSKLDP